MAFLPFLDSLCLQRILSQYRYYLKTRYDSQELPTSSQWPPMPVTKIFKLAMIKKEKIQRGRIDDELVQLTITGKVDDILQEKIPVNLEEIFPQCDRRRKLVLLEGAPGSGKSTLTLHICQEWGKEKLFQEYSIVILVRLRDPLIRNAKTIADLLPCVDKAMANEVETLIKSQYGAGVLWVMDGWDELPSDLPSDSIINKLIKPRMFLESPLLESSVIVTSRPSSSAELHPLVSSRVEVLGFTPRELEQYFRECLKHKSGLLQTLLDRIRENPVVEGSCYLPLNAAIVAHVFLCCDHSLPTSNHGIFAAVIQNILKRYLHDKLGKATPIGDITSLDTLPSEIQTTFRQLCQLAFYGIENSKLTFSIDDLTALSISKYISEVGVLQSVPSIISDDHQIYFCFLHLSIQELLAAVHISYLPPEQQIVAFQELFGIPQFNTMFQFYAGITKLRTIYSPIKSPQMLHQEPTSIYDLINKLVKQELNETILVTLLHCLYEAEDPSLCAFVTDLLGHSLYLTNTTLKPIDCLSVGYFLSVVCTTCTVSSIISADLIGCSLGDQGCKFLVRGLCKCLKPQTKITSKLALVLQNNDIRKEGINHIAQLLKNTSVVWKLDLSNNSMISDDGLQTLCEALSTNTSLKTLALSYCSIENSELFLCQLLSNNTSLQCLKFTGNKITKIQSVAAALSNNRTLQDLRFCYCDLTDKCVEELSKGLSSYLVKLNIAHNSSITESGLDILMRRLTTFSAIRKLTIPARLVKSSFIKVLNHVNEERKRKRLPEIEVIGGCHIY